MTVTELIEELQALNGDLVVVNSDGDEVDSAEEGSNGDEAVLFTVADDDEAESEAIDAEATPA